jgi:hypothetical protein
MIAQEQITSLLRLRWLPALVSVQPTVIIVGDLY